ncbi:MAG: SGNH/GDSL hydrolase family protein [Halieaceae bacterium]
MRINSQRLLLVTMLFSLAYGCTMSTSPEEATDHIQEQRAWRVQCESALKPWPEEGSNPESAKPKGWIVARTPGNGTIDLWGELEDGFVQVKRVVSTDLKWSLDPDEPYKHLRAVCRDTLKQRSDGDQFRLGLVRTSKNDEGVYTSFLFDEWSGRDEITRVIVFGDSLSDTGILKRRLRLVPKRPYWLGRFSNGPVWTDYLEASADLAVQNHAVGGAMSSELYQFEDEELSKRIFTNGQFFVSGSISDQIDAYVDNYLNGGTLGHADQTVAILWAGANDYISKEAFSRSITLLLGSPASEEGYLNAVEQVIESTENQLEKLRTAGMKHMLVMTLPDLGLTPMVLHNDSYAALAMGTNDVERRVELSKRLSELTLWHNTALTKMVEKFQAEHPEIAVMSLNTNELLARVQDPAIGGQELGFELDKQKTPLGEGYSQLEIQERCYSGMSLGLLADEESICKDANRNVFWDLVHPSTYFHCWIGYAVGETLNEAGWIAPMRDQEQHKAWCERIADAY